MTCYAREGRFASIRASAPGMTGKLQIVTEPSHLRIGLSTLLGNPRPLWSSFPSRSRVWVVIVALAFLAVTAMLYTVPDVALEHWYLFTMPLTIAAFVFGLRGALFGAIVAALCLTFLFFSSLAVHTTIVEALTPVVD